MRKLIGLMVFLVAVLAVVAAVAAVNLNSYLNDNKDWIADQLADSLGRPVDFDAVGLSFRSGLAVEVSGFRVGEDERFAESDGDEFLSVGSTFVRVALWPALFGKVEIGKVSLRDVRMTVIQSEAGLSTDSLGESGEPAPAGPTGQASAGTAGTGATEPKMSLPKTPESSKSSSTSFSIAMAEVRSGSIRYLDRTTDPEREVVIEQLEFWTSDVSLDRPISFQFTGAVLDEGEANLRIHGLVGPLPTNDNDAIPLDFQFSLDPIDAAALPGVPGLADSFDPEHPPSGTLKLSGSVAGSTSNPKLTLEFDGTDALVPLGEDSQKEIGAPLRLAVNLGLTGQDLEINTLDLEFEGIKLRARGSITNLEDPTADLTIEVFGGTIEIDGGWSAQGHLELDTRLTNIELGEMTRSLASESAQLLDGRLSMSLAFTGTGETWPEIKPGLEGLGGGQIDSGVLHDINLVEEAFVGITGVPGLSEELPKKLGKKYPKLFSTGDTEFERMTARVEVREGRVQILGIQLDADDYGMRGWGSVSLDGDLDLSTRLSLSSSLSADLIDRANPLKHLRGKDGRVEIPIRIRGELPDVSAKPDTDAIAKKLGAGAAQNVAKKSFKKLRKKKKKKKGNSAASVDSGREILERLLR